MQRFPCLASLILLAVAPLASAVPDESGKLVEPGAAAEGVSSDATMSARLHYNVGFERFEATQKLEMTAAGQKGATARTPNADVRMGYTDARARFRAAAEADPGMKEAWNLIGYTSRRLGDYEASLKAYDKALALSPDYPEAIEYRAELFVLTGRLEDAKAAHAVLLKSSPSYADVLKASMEDWLASGASAPGVGPAEREALATWLKAR
jgi:tetratricopeptide (TPR) repeat protein